MSMKWLVAKVAWLWDGFRF